MHENAHHVNAHFHGLAGCQHIGGLNGAVLGEGVGQNFEKLQFLEVVTVCDHLGLLGGGELE